MLLSDNISLTNISLTVTVFITPVKLFKKKHLTPQGKADT